MGEKKKEEMIPVDIVEPEIMKLHTNIYDHQPILVGSYIYDDLAKNDPVIGGKNNPDFYLRNMPKYVLESLTTREKELLMEMYDPIAWAKKNIYPDKGGFQPRTSRFGYPYQSAIIRCTSRRIVVRAGRRVGKSVSIVVKILHKIFTNDGFRVVIFTPFASQQETLWKFLTTFIDSNDALREQVVRTVKTPVHRMELRNGSSITGFVGGSESVRSSAADFIYIDEASFIKQEALDAVIALLMEKPETELIMTSTPRGVKDFFMSKINDPRFVSFHFPANVYSPSWNDDMENEARSHLTQTGYIHEVLAEITVGDERVYRDDLLTESMSDYEYASRPTEDGWIYAVGVDWNHEGTGTHIVITGYNPKKAKKYKIWARYTVDIETWSQLKAIEKIVSINRIWKPAFIYIDRGFGYTNEELLHKIGINAANNTDDKRLLSIVKSIYFSQNIEIYDPWVGKKVKQPVKPFMVNQSVKLFEDGIITISSKDVLLIKQLENYAVLKYTANGVPVYGGYDSKIGDHSIDAMNLSILAFFMEGTEFGRGQSDTEISHIDSNIIRRPFDDKKEDAFFGTVVVEPPGMQQDKEKERREFLEANGLDEINSSMGYLTQRAPAANGRARFNMSGRRLFTTRRTLGKRSF